MTYKLVAIDLDGTLLDPYLKISQRSLGVIQEAIEKGVIITLSTGRMFAAALPFARELQLDVPIITCNGAAVICAQTQKIYHEKSLPYEVILDVINMARELKMELSLYTVHDIYVEDITNNTHIHEQIDNAEVKKADLTEIAREKSIIKILFSSSELYKHAEEVYQQFKRDCTFYFSLPWFVEIVGKGVDKADALKEVANKFHVHPEEIIAIGDNFNDLPMIKYAGLGVAMGNAPKDLKELANYVTRAHDDDGVAHVIENFIIKSNHTSYAPQV